MNEMRKLMETIKQLDESAGATVYVGMADEPYQGLHTIKEWEATSDPQWAAKQSEKFAENYWEDYDVVVLAYTAGRRGFEEVERIGGRDKIDKERELGEDSFKQYAEPDGIDDSIMDGVYRAGDVEVEFDGDEVALRSGHGENIWLRRSEWRDFVNDIKKQDL